MRKNVAALAVLGIGQLVSWGTLYYGITFLAGHIRQETGWSLERIFGAFSAGLLLTALVMPYAGRMLRRHGGRPVMAAGSLLAACALVVVAASRDFPCFLMGWLLAGIAMSMTLYEAAFSTLREITALDFRRSIGIVTIVGGFASTLFWPLTHWLADGWGWRVTLLLYAGMHLLLCASLYWVLPIEAGRIAGTGTGVECIPQVVRRKVILLATFFALAAVATAAISSHAALMMADRHVPEGLAMTALVLIGPMQVVGRIAELFAAQRFSAAVTGMAGLVALVASLLLLQFVGSLPWLVFGFALAYGAANGIMTLVRGAIVAELFEKNSYAVFQGIMAMPTILARALGPVLLAWAVGNVGMNMAIWMLVLMLLAGGVCYRAALTGTTFGYSAADGNTARVLAAKRAVGNVDAMASSNELHRKS